MIRAEHLGQIVRIVDVDGKAWRGKVVELVGPEDSDSREIELGIDYAGGITMFTESEIAELRVMDGDMSSGNTKRVEGRAMPNIKREYLGKKIKIISSDGLEYTGKAVELQGPEETTSGEVELGINYAGGIRMFTENDIDAIEVVK